MNRTVQEHGCDKCVLTCYCIFMCVYGLFHPSIQLFVVSA